MTAAEVFRRLLGASSCGARAFSRAEFEPRTVVEFEGLRVPIATAEDVILAKLEWAKLGGSARQIEDAAGILRARASELALDYIERWIEELGVEQERAAARRVGLPFLDTQP